MVNHLIIEIIVLTFLQNIWRTETGKGKENPAESVVFYFAFAIFRPFSANSALKGRNIIAQGTRPVKNKFPRQPQKP